MSESENPFAVKNVRLFLWFRILFNARFYYPVFTILFLDYGMTLSQFAILNVVWAITIILLEVPSGAIADTFGRKRLMVFATATMVLEMALVCFIPLGNVTLVFYALLINRILSGFAEAMASGADEALAYDSLVAQGKEHLWSKALALLMNRSAIAMMIAMLVGGAIYDAGFLNKVLTGLSVDFQFEASTTMRFPMYLTLCTGCIAFVISLQMKEIKSDQHQDDLHQASKSFRHAFRLTLQTGIWIMKSPLVLFIILMAMNYDSVARMFVTLGSEYYRFIGYQEASFGLISSGIAIIGILISKYAESLVQKFSMYQNLSGLGVFLCACLFGVSVLSTKWGLLFAMGIFASLYLISFFISHYLNQQVPSEQRATALSFRSLACNLAYAGVGLLYAKVSENKAQELSQKNIFNESLTLFPYLLIGGSVLVVLCVYFQRNKIHTKVE